MPSRGGGSRASRGAGEGLLLEPFLHKYTEMTSCCKRHQITIWKHGFQAAKPRVSGRETKGFRVWNPWFCKWEVSTFKSERKEDENRGDCYYFNKCFVKICKTNKIKKCLKWGSFCINMQNHLYIIIISAINSVDLRTPINSINYTKIMFFIVWKKKNIVTIQR